MDKKQRGAVMNADWLIRSFLLIIIGFGISIWSVYSWYRNETPVQWMLIGVTFIGLGIYMARGISLRQMKKILTA